MPSLLALASRLENPRPGLVRAGEALVERIGENFERQSAPDGTPWTPLAPFTIKERRKKGTLSRGILRDEGSLESSVHFAFQSPDRIIAGPPPSVKAHTHQEGGTVKRNGKTYRIPARPYVPTAEQARARVVGTFHAYLMESR